MTVEESNIYIEKKNKELLLLKDRKEHTQKSIDKFKYSLKHDDLEKDIKVALKKELKRDLSILKELNSDIKSLSKILVKENKNLEKKLVPKKELDFIWKILTGFFGIGFLFLLMIMAVIKSGSIAWIGATFLMLFMFLGVLMFLIYLAKKTHAILEFKAIMSGKPLCLFFTDHKRVDWKVLEPEAGIINDTKYGSFLVNQKGSYVDEKTKNVLMAFNPSIGTNAPVEAFKLTDSLSKVLNDERKLSEVRMALAKGDFEGDRLTIVNENGDKEEIRGLPALKESIDFSPLKSLMNSILPHNLTSKVEMTVQQRTGGKNNINVGQIVLIVVSIIGATVLAAMLLKTTGGSTGGATTTIIREVATQAAVNMTTGNTMGG